MEEEREWTVVGATDTTTTTEKERKEELINEFFNFTKMFTVYNAMLFIEHIRNLTEWKGLLFHKHMPVKGFTVLGIVTEVRRKDTVLFVRVDDGTGCIKCVLFLKATKMQCQMIEERRWTDEFKSKTNLMATLDIAKNNLLVSEELQLGSFVQVVGNLKVYQGKLEIVGDIIRKLDPDYEAYYLNLKLELHKKFYDLHVSWKEQFAKFKKGNPGIYAVKYLREKNLPTFTLEDLKEHYSIILKESGLDIAMSDMRKAGFMYKDGSGSYQIVELDNELQEFVFNYVKDETGNSDKDIDTRKVHSHARQKYPNVDLENIKICLECLEFRSLVHSTRDGEHYRVV